MLQEHGRSQDVHRRNAKTQDELTSAALKNKRQNRNSLSLVKLELLTLCSSVEKVKTHCMMAPKHPEEFVMHQCFHLQTAAHSVEHNRLPCCVTECSHIIYTHAVVEISPGDHGQRRRTSKRQREGDGG